MRRPPAQPPSRPPRHRAAALAATALAACSTLLLTLVATEWHPLLALDGAIAGTTHRWAAGERSLTHAFRILTSSTISAMLARIRWSCSLSTLSGSAPVLTPGTSPPPCDTGAERPRGGEAAQGMRAPSV